MKSVGSALLAIVVVAGIVAPSAAQDRSPRKLAYLIGVSKYDRDGLSNLQFPEKDVEALEAALKRADFTVRKLLGSASGNERATRANLERYFGAARVGDTVKLGEWLQELAKLGKEDVALIAVSGHGLQRSVTRDGKSVDDAFFCPVDANKNDPATLFSVGELMKNVGDYSGTSQNLIVIDACRDDPGKGARSLDGSTMRALPSKISILFGSSAGQQSWESKELGHGLLTHALLEGLNGKAARDGEVTWNLLTSYAQSRVRTEAKKLSQEQKPNIIMNLTDDPVLARVAAGPAVTTPAVGSRPIATGKARPPLLDSTNGTVPAADVKRLQKEWAEYLGLNVEVVVEGATFMLVPPGKFYMGASDKERTDKTANDNESPRHVVTISEPMYVGKHEVTYGEFKRFVGATNQDTEAERQGGFGWNYTVGAFEGPKMEYTWKFTGFPQSDDHPVVNVGWHDAKAFCAWLGSRPGLPKEFKIVRLPREAEWEYCCRAGTTTRHFSGETDNSLVLAANIADESLRTRFKDAVNPLKQDDGNPFTAKVGRYRANAFGLHDMAGNVWEWCDDARRSYSNERRTDADGGSGGVNRMTRGGSFWQQPRFVRAAFRNELDAASRNYDLGFRVVLVR